MANKNMSLSKQIEDLIEQQIKVGVVDDCFTSKKDSGVYYVNIGSDGKFLCQVNPKRDPKTRSVLKTGKKGCFLCEENMPEEECGIEIDRNWKIYPNPRPYEKNHVVMVLKKTEGCHPFQIIDKKELITKAIETIWQLGYTEKRDDFNLTFNSLGAAASSRHFHYQIFECKLPIFDFSIDFIKEKKGVKIGTIKNYPANVLVLEGKNREAISSKLWFVIDKLNTHSYNHIPYVVLFRVINKNIRVYIFPRDAETPFETCPNLIKIKFGICEMCGLTIVYNSDMAQKIDLEIFKKSLEVSSNTKILTEITLIL